LYSRDCHGRCDRSWELHSPHPFADVRVVHRLRLQASSASAPRTAPYIRRFRDQHVVGRATTIASSNTTRAGTPSGREAGRLLISCDGGDETPSMFEDGEFRRLPATEINKRRLRPAQITQVLDLFERVVHQIPNTRRLPIAQAPPARHSRRADAGDIGDTLRSHPPSCRQLALAEDLRARASPRVRAFASCMRSIQRR
jgi:hypothetical protein